MCKKIFMSLFLFSFLFLAESCLAGVSANIDQAKSDIVSLMREGNYAQAQLQTQQLIAKFSGNKNLPEALYWIARKFGYSDRYKEEKSAYQQIIRNYSDSSWASKARLGFARANVLSLIKSQDYDGAKAAFDKLVVDFSGHPDLLDTLYWIAQKYGWSERHEEEKSVYQKIIQNYPGNSRTSKAMLGFAKANVQSLIISQNDDGAKEALDKLVADFSGNPDLPETLYWIADRYEWSGGYEQAKNLHQQIIRNSPGSPFANKAKLGLARAEVSSLMMSQDSSKADKALDEMVADFSKHPDLPRAILIIGEQCYNKGLSNEEQELHIQAKECFGKAAKIWGKFVNELPVSSLTPEACCRAGDCYHKLGKNEESMQCFKKVVDNCPDYDYIWHAQFMVGRCYEELKKAGVVEKSLANAQTKAAYEKVIRNYPNCRAAEYAHRWLSDGVSVGKEK